MKITKNSYRYFVSYTFIKGGHTGFGHSQATIEAPILTMDDVVKIAKSLTLDLQADLDVVILNYIRLEG